MTAAETHALVGLAVGLLGLLAGALGWGLTLQVRRDRRREVR